MRNNESVKADLHHAVMDIVREKNENKCVQAMIRISKPLKMTLKLKLSRE